MNEPRDEALDRLLRQTLRPASGADSTPSCLDAETMSAWMDGGLSGAALAAAEGHAATCPRCRALAAVIARSESFDARPAAMPASEGRRARTWWPWFVPLAAAALIAVAVWIPRGAPQPTPQSTISQASPTETASQTPSLDPLAARPQTPPEQNAQEAAAKEAPAVKTETGRADKAEVKPEAMPEPPPVPPAPPVESRQTFRVAASPPAVAPPPAPSPAPPAPVVPETTAPATAARALADAAPVVRPEPAAGAASDRTATEAVIAEFQSPNVLPPPAAVGAAGGRAGVPGAAAGGRGGGGRGGAAGVARPSPPPTPTQWRVLASGSVQRSNPPGAPWVLVQIDPGARVTNGDASSSLVCWLVGRNGVVFLTENGGSFMRIPFPEAVDLASVRATSAREATVTTMDGRTFQTRDGGQSWSRN